MLAICVIYIYIYTHNAHACNEAGALGEKYAGAYARVPCAERREGYGALVSSVLFQTAALFVGG